MAIARTPVLKRPGELRHLVTLQSSDTTKDVLGGQEQDAYAVFASGVKASIAEIPFIVNGSEHGMLYDVTIRYLADVLTEFRTNKKRVQVVGPDQTYNVLEVEDPDHRHVQLVLHCAPA